MLDPWIIEEIRRKEEEERRDERLPAILELPIPIPRNPERSEPDRTPVEPGRPANDEEGPRGVVIIDYNVGYGSGSGYGYGR
jgi:hypothetical protein